MRSRFAVLVLATFLTCAGCARERFSTGREGGSVDAGRRGEEASSDGAIEGSIDAAEWGQPPGFGDAIALSELQDEDPRPQVVAVSLVARMGTVEVVAGHPTSVPTYDGTVPGPLIRARRGQTLRVSFRNELDVPTTVHWHGVRVPNAMDGVPGHTQPPVEPGASFVYELALNDAGLFWYHPHVDSAAQVGSGLYGALLVEDPDEPAPLGDELVLVLSDLGVDELGALKPRDVGGDLGTLFGREGEYLLVNGRPGPVLEALAGLRQRWRIVNAAKSRYFQLVLDGHRFTRIGGDAGLLERAVELDALVVVPGERADVLVTPSGEPGSRLDVRWVPYDRGYGSTEFRSEERLFTLHLVGAVEGAGPRYAQAQGPAIEPLPTAGATEQTLELTMGASSPLELGINGVPAWRAEPLTAVLGSVQVWSIRNTMEWAHPFHLHGYFFQVLDQNGLPPDVLEWKDTVDVPVDATVRIATRFDERPGMWMFHCHILDHADAGMMGMVEVVP